LSVPEGIRTLDAIRVPVRDRRQAEAFFGAVFGWDFDPVADIADLAGGTADVAGGTGDLAGGTAAVARQAGSADDLAPSAELVFTTRDPGPVLCLSGSDPQADAERLALLGGRVRVAAATVTGTDPEGTLLHLSGQPGTTVPRAAGAGTALRGTTPSSRAGGPRGVLGVIFVYVRDLDGAADFYHEFCGWSFTAVGRDRDILFAEVGPPLGLRPAAKKPDGQTGAVGFYVTVRAPARVAGDILTRGGQAGPPQGAGAFTIRPCRDDQGTAFGLWSD